jgi:hypothetical protein
MLATYRVPVSDARGLAADHELASSVVLPAAWAQGDFVRGVGEVTRRLGGAVEPWAFESAYADARRMLSVSSEAVRRFNLGAGGHRIQSIRKRAWMALPASRALIDFDIALQLTSSGATGVHGRQEDATSLAGLADVIALGASLPVHLRSDPPAVTRSLLTLGKPLAAHFAQRTSAVSDGARLVSAGRITAVVEAPGINIHTDGAIRSEQLEGGRIRLASTNVAVPGGGSLRCHVLWSTTRSKGDRKRIRELRIHILRLHSIFELMRFLCSHIVIESMADVVGSIGFDQLQQTLLSCVRVVRTRQSPGDTGAGRVLDTAFFSKSFVDRDLELMLARALGAMRPKVRNEVEEFLASERRRAAYDLIASRQRERLEAETIIMVQGDYNQGNKYVVSGTVVGPVGDNATVQGNVIGDPGQTITIGCRTFASSDLASELQQLRVELSKSQPPDGVDVEVPLRDAEHEAARGNASGVVAALKKLGAWVIGVGERIGVPLATAAIQASIGLS